MGNFSMLSVNLISNILTRLPTETVLDCKLVSKSWNSVINRQSFSQSHLNRCLKDLDSAGACDGKFTFLFLNDNPIQAYRQFHYLELHDDENLSSEEKQPCHRVTRMKLNPAPFQYYNLIGSCNGLVCLNGCPVEETESYEPTLYICNPITRECVFLPEFEKKSGRGEGLLTGFGYVSKTNEYKVMRVYNLLEEPNFVHAEVYTLGSGKGWRNVGKQYKENLDKFISKSAMFVNTLEELLCWKHKDGRVLAFNLSSETIFELPTSCDTPWKNFRLGVLGGCLSATHHHKDSGTYIIMALKKKIEDGTFRWTVEFIQSSTDANEYLVLTSRGAILHRSTTKVLISDLHHPSTKLLVDFGKDNCIHQAIPHMNTLVSLKALGEENTKTMEIADVPGSREVRRKTILTLRLNQGTNNLDSSSAGSGGKFAFLFVNDYQPYAEREFHYCEFYDKENSSSEEKPFRSTRIKLDTAPFRFTDITGSCNGLVCLNGCHDGKGVDYEPVYVCNPITRECVFLPEFQRTDDRGKRLLTGFGYVSKSNEYKVVRMYKLLEEPKSIYAEVYTLGSGKGWRNLGKKFDEDLDSFVSNHAVFDKQFELLCWQLKSGRVLAFILSDEIIVEIPTSDSFPWRFKLGVLGGCLSATSYHEASNTYLVLVWKRKRENGPFTWIKEFILSNTYAHEWLGLTSRRALLCHSKAKVLFQDLNSVYSELLVDFGNDRPIHQAIPHTNTLVSLKALGEENTKTMETDDTLEEYKSLLGKQIEGMSLQQ